MDHDQLIQNLAQNNLSLDERQFIFKLLKNSRKAKIALRVNYYFHLGHSLDLTNQGAFIPAGNDMGCHPRTCQRHYYSVYPKRLIVIEKPITPALSFPRL